MGESNESSFAVMEMVDRQNQPKIVSIWNNSNKAGDEWKHDRISALPDCVLLEILSRLPSIKDAIKTGTLSKRWKHLWTLVPNLIFNHDCTHNHLSRYKLFPLVDKILTQCRQLKLKKFKVYTTYHIRFESQVNNWIRYAVSRNVEELTLGFVSATFKGGYLLDQPFFTGSSFTDLRLAFCQFNPTGTIRWKNLRSLFISVGKLNEDVIENILSGSPVLETLVLDHCYDFKRLNITSKSVKNLVLGGYMDPDDKFYDPANYIEINASNILSLTIQDYFYLAKLSLLNVSSLVEAKVDYALVNHNEESEEEMLKGSIINLRHVKDLKIGSVCSKALSHLQAKGFIIPSNVKCHGITYDRLE